MKKLVLIAAAAMSFAFAPVYGVDNIDELVELSKKLQAETERAKAAKTPEEQEAVVKELERLTRRVAVLAGMTQADTEACIASLRESFKLEKGSKAAKDIDKADKKLKQSAKMLDETQKLMNASDGKKASGGKDGKNK